MRLGQLRRYPAQTKSNQLHWKCWHVNRNATSGFFTLAVLLLVGCSEVRSSAWQSPFNTSMESIPNTCELMAFTLYFFSFPASRKLFAMPITLVCFSYRGQHGATAVREKRKAEVRFTADDLGGPICCTWDRGPRGFFYLHAFRQFPVNADGIRLK